LVATNYNPVTGTWTDTSGNNNHATQGTAASRPSLIANQTANGSAVVSFDGADDTFNLTASIPTASDAAGYTVLAYLRRPTKGGAVVCGTAVGPGNSSLEYSVNGGGKQYAHLNNITALGTGNSALSNSEFSSVNIKVNDTGGTFRLNGAADGTCSGSTFTQPLTAVGRDDHAEGTFYSADIAEIRVYDEQLSLAAIQAIEAEFTAAYETATDAVSLPVIDNPGFDTDAYLFIDNNGVAGAGSNPAEIADWPGSGVRGINPGAGAFTAFRNNGNNAGQVAFLGAASVSQPISGWEVGESYRLTFDYNARSGYDNPGVTATLGGSSFSDANIPPVGGSYRYYAANILHTATNATETLTITSLDNPGDDTLLVDNIRVFRTGPSIADNGFESPVQPDDDFELASGAGGGDLTGSLWTSITGTAGITRNRSGFHSSMYASEGEQFAVIQGTGSFVQTVSGFTVGAEHELSLLTMKRPSYGGNDLEVILDKGLGTELVLIDIAEVTATAFEEVTATFTATKASYTLTIEADLNGGALSGDRTTFVDNVWINQLTVDPAPSGTIFIIR